MDKSSIAVSVETLSQAIRDHLDGIQRPIIEEIRNYPPPVAGCDAQYNHLMEQRGRLSLERARLDAIDRSDAPPEARLRELNDFMESSAFIDPDTAEKIRQRSA